MKKTLYLEKRGGDFYDDERRLNQLSDVGNFRVGIYDYSIKGKNGRNFILEFGTYTRYTYRKTHKVTGKPLKKAIREIELENALHIDTQYEREETREIDGKKFMCAYRDLKLEKDINNRKLHYTLADILKVVNYISAEQYTDIAFKER